MRGLEGRIVIVTGAASGIGLATAARLVAEGARVTGIDVAEAPDVVAGVSQLRLDVTDEGAVAAAVDDVADAGGRLDGVVHAAGIAGGGPVHMVDADSWRRVVDVNLTATFFVLKHAVR